MKFIATCLITIALITLVATAADAAFNPGPVGGPTSSQGSATR
jgi:hypothetical protein